jgi:hypothetical protein
VAQFACLRSPISRFCSVVFWRGAACRTPPKTKMRHYSQPRSVDRVW